MDINHDTKKLFMYAILCLSLAVGLSSGVFSNYFKEVFAVDSVQRGLLEIPRETPGILCVVIRRPFRGSETCPRWSWPTASVPWDWQFWAFYRRHILSCRSFFFPFPWESI